MTNLKNQNAGGKVKQSNVQKFARGGASMYDPYSYMAQGDPPCTCVCENGSECQGHFHRGDCNCVHCCEGWGEPKPPPSAMGRGGRTRSVMGRGGTISLKASRAKALAIRKRVSKGKIRNLSLAGGRPPRI